MSYVDDNLIAGEQVIYRTRLHWVLLVLPILVSLLLSIAASALYSEESTRSIAWPLFLLAALPILQAYIIRRSSEFAVTDKRILLKTGILRRHTMETLVTKVENISVDQSVLGRILNYGTITVTGTGATKESFERLADPLQFRKQVQTATLKREEQRGRSEG